MRNGENGWPKWIRLTLKVSTLSVVQLCSKLNEKLQIRINTELLQSKLPIPNHVLGESLHRDALSTAAAKAELWQITEVWHHRSFSQESRSLGAWAALQLSLCCSENSRLWSRHGAPGSASCPFDFLTDIWKQTCGHRAQALLVASLFSWHAQAFPSSLNLKVYCLYSF